MLLTEIARSRVETSRTSLYSWSFLFSLIICRDSQIASQINALNQAYGTCGLSFVLAGTDRTTNVNWFNTVAPNTSAQQSMKNSLYQGAAAYLNVYSVG